VENKKILLGVTGGIAAYKAAILVRLLVKAGAQVQIIMTEFAKKFITPLTLATLSKRPILVQFFDVENGNWNSHVDLGLWADAMIIAPATANSIAKMANGVADNLLVTTYLSARCPVFIAPAMDLDMYQHFSTQKNIETLKKYGNIFIEPETGELASGLIGKGRMAEPEQIVAILNDFFDAKKPLVNKKIVVTAGPTYEYIDSVRFIGNFSSGKMGYAIAETLAEKGAEVVLISGPTHLQCKSKNIQRVDVVTAEEMYLSVIKYFKSSDVCIMSAAVADFKPKERFLQKIKQKSMTLELVETQDIAKKMGEMKTEKQLLIGFALETHNEVENAMAKIKKKNFDFIVLNSLNDEGAGFHVDTNKVSIIDKFGSKTDFPLKSKMEVAKDIVEKLIEIL
jgi:phosphopantothenoylcysteine decarboxylase/phosphopantothenate--cysteine ligase